MAYRSRPRWHATRDAVLPRLVTVRKSAEQWVDRALALDTVAQGPIPNPSSWLRSTPAESRHRATSGAGRGEPGVEQARVGVTRALPIDKTGGAGPGRGDPGTADRPRGWRGHGLTCGVGPSPTATRSRLTGPPSNFWPSSSSGSAGFPAGSPGSDRRFAGPIPVGSATARRLRKEGPTIRGEHRRRSHPGARSRSSARSGD